MLLYGKPVADQLQEGQTERIRASGLTPHLAIIQAGNDLASTTYIRMKQRYGEAIGARVDHMELPSELEPLQETIAKLNADSGIHGIIVQLPLPNPSITQEVVATIAPDKDVDGLSSAGPFRSATAMAVLKLLEGYDIKLEGQRVTLVGHGRLVGGPLAELLRKRHAKLMICDAATPDLPAATRAAQILISATGVPGLIKPDMVSEGAVVVDVGTAEAAGAVVGDTDPALQQNPNLSITPPQGGVGPITVAMLFEQLLAAAGL